MAEPTVSFQGWCEAKVRELNALTPRAAFMTETQECSVERAAQSIHIAVADFFIGIQLAQTNAEALRLFEMISPLVLVVQAAESAALNRADELTGKGR